MDQDQKNSGSAGAPSTDTTQALFVSARKKQLEQQEAERIAKEREAERLAAEAEVRRLEQEVAERKRRAQEEAKRVEEEAARRREQAKLEARQAEEEARTRAAAQDAQPAPEKVRSASKPAPATKPKKQAGQKTNKMVLIGGGVVLAIVAMVLIIVLTSGGGNKANEAINTEGFSHYLSSGDGLGIYYPTGWDGGTVYDSDGIFLENTDEQSTIFALNIDKTLTDAAANGMDPLNVTEELLYQVAGVFAEGGAVNDMVPNLQKSGSAVRGEAEFYYNRGNIPMKGFAKIENYDGVPALTAYAIPSEEDSQRRTALCEAILSTLSVQASSGDGASDPGDQTGDQTDDADGDNRPYWETDDQFTFIHDGETGIYAYIPAVLEDSVQFGMQEDFYPSYAAVGQSIMLCDYTDLYREMVINSGRSLELLADFAVDGAIEDEPRGELNFGGTYPDGNGQRMDFGFDKDGSWMTGALHIDEVEQTCLLVLGVDLDEQYIQYFDVIAASVGIAVQ